MPIGSAAQGSADSTRGLEAGLNEPRRNTVSLGKLRGLPGRPRSQRGRFGHTKLLVNERNHGGRVAGNVLHSGVRLRPRPLHRRVLGILPQACQHPTAGLLLDPLGHQVQAGTPHVFVGGFLVSLVLLHSGKRGSHFLAEHFATGIESDPAIRFVCQFACNRDTVANQINVRLLPLLDGWMGLMDSVPTSHQTPVGLAFSGSILYCLIARATSFPFILPSAASAAIAAWAM